MKAIRPSIARLLIGLLAFAGAAAATLHASARAEPDYREPILKIRGRDMQRWSMYANGEIYGPAECSPTAWKISQLANDYKVGAYLDRTLWNSAKAHRKIQEVLEAIPSTDPCYRWYHGLYVMESVKGYGYFANDEYTSLYNVLSELYYAERLAPLSPELRREWGGLWNATPTKILGAYNCETSTVYVDTTQRLYNLGAVVAHELEHLMRDKFSYWEGKDGTFVRDVNTTLLLDEALSTLHAGFTQLSFRADNNRDSDGVNGRALRVFELDASAGFRLFSHKDRAHYRLGSDLNLYKKGGHLQTIWKESIRARGFRRGSIFVHFLDETILPMAARGTGDEHLRGILDIVGGAYFGSQSPAPAVALAELSRWRRTDPDYVSPLGYLQLRAHKKISEKVTQLDPGVFDTLRERLASPSRGCLAISAAIRRGEAAQYIGSQLGSQTGARPKGGEGARTSGDVRLEGGEGARTGGDVRLEGGEGARTGGPLRLEGGEGARTGQPLTPCLAPEEKI